MVGIENCELCNTENKESDPDYMEKGSHMSCWEEQDRRVWKKLCIFCGVLLGELAIKEEDACHENCSDINNYKGYPYQ